MTTVQVDALESALVAASVGAVGLCRVGRPVSLHQLQLDLPDKAGEMGRLEPGTGCCGDRMAECLIRHRTLLS